MTLLGIRQPLVLSPMVDVTDAAFRSLAAGLGADITCSEMVAAAGIVHDNPASWTLLRRWPGESPYGVQLMASEAEEMAEAVRRIGTRMPGLDFVDLNLGCPSPHVLRSAAGAFLLRDPAKAGRVLRAARTAADEVGIPHVSAKLRLGHDDAHRTYLDVGAEAQAAGAAWVTLHGRTVVQGYSGHADWGAIRRLVEALDIPVVGNGDLRTPDDVLRMRDETHCAGFFIARAAMNDPTVFTRMRAALDGRPVPGPPSLEERIALLRTYLERAAMLGIDAIGPLRRQATRFVSGAPGAKKWRIRFHEATDRTDLLAALDAVLDRASDQGTP